jgi:hypothetical protein
MLSYAGALFLTVTLTVVSAYRAPATRDDADP